MIIEHLRVSGSADSWDLYNQNSQLEEKVAEMQKTIEAFSAGSSGQARRLIQVEEASAEKDKTIASLETEKNRLTQTVSDLRTVNSEQDQEISNLRSQIAVIRQLLQE
jgi:chromosome segregation ATPase